MAEEMRGTRDLVLPPSTFAYVLDSTKGKVSVFVGPFKNSLSDTDRLVLWDSAGRRYVNSSTVEQAIQTFAVAGEGEYVVLENPASTAGEPIIGTASDAVALDVGRKVNIPGPATFPLWPGQAATTIAGHHLRHNQYLLTRVYAPEQVTVDIATAVPTMGQLAIVRGVDVSFYIPPTGIEVVPEQPHQYVREAVTLERLEYCILLDENGDKRYVRGPDVVFPAPTETFVSSSSRQSRKFLAIELNPHSGIYVKVIAEYDDPDGHHDVGEELFITGDQTAIFFPRPEHSIIQYDDQKVHYAIAIPAGEGRYVLDRDSGEVTLERGPAMFLPDPRREVVVLRVLDPGLVELLYPNNDEALAVNIAYAAENEATGARHLRSLSNAAVVSAASANVMSSMSDTYAGTTRTKGLASNSYVGDTFKRGTTPRPRSVVLDTKYDGAIGISIWPGYAVLVTNKLGARRVEVGPKVVLLDYDESVMPLSLSTGKPKNTDRLLKTAYLRVTNNQIGDVVTVECRDLVEVRIKLSYRVNFEGGNPLKWFDTENYVKVLTDHARSRLRSAAKRLGVLELTSTAIDMVRDTLLGPSAGDGTPRTGLLFEENGMRVYDVEVLAVDIIDTDVAHLLSNAQSEALEGAIELSAAEERTARSARMEELRRDEIETVDETSTLRAAVTLRDVERDRTHKLAIGASTHAQAIAAYEVEQQRVELLWLQAEHQLRVRVARDAAATDVLRAEVEQFVARMQAISPDFIGALQNFGERDFVAKLVEAVGPAAAAAGVTSADIFSQVFTGTPFAGFLDAMATRPLVSSNGRREVASADA